MTGRARTLRLGAAATCFGLLVAGSALGSDDHFPFGPFRMFANASKADGVISVPVLTGVLDDGSTVPLASELLGLRRAELEGRLRWFAVEPSRLSLFAERWADAHPERPRMVAVHLERRRQPLRDRQPVGPATVVPVTSWEEE